MPEKPAKTLTDRMRGIASSVLDPLGMLLHRWGIHPDLITVLGLIVVGIAAIFIAQGQMLLGAVILLLGLPLDAVDGAVARAMQRTDKFGAVLDSTLDRYADGFIFAALSYHFAMQNRFELLVLAQAALLGSFLVSYVRARGEGLAVSVKEGFFTRLERVFVIVVMLLIPPLLDWGVLLLAVGTNVTALQRLWYVNHFLNNKGE